MPIHYQCLQYETLGIEIAISIFLLVITPTRARSALVSHINNNNTILTRITSRSWISRNVIYW
jgi:hypothetical protein